jgi:hypothetical protein
MVFTLKLTGADDVFVSLYSSLPPVTELENSIPLSGASDGDNWGYARKYAPWLAV